MGGGTGEASLACLFARAASRYWIAVLPRVCQEIMRWRRHAAAIPDPQLRGLALGAQRMERGNLEGAAAFAVLVPLRHCATVVRALVAFQAIYDYADALAEQPSEDPRRNGRQLHQALLDALDLDGWRGDYYAHFRQVDDRGYIAGLVGACRSAVAALPSYAAVAAPALRSIARMVAYQALNHERRDGSYRMLARWASRQTPPGADLRWWETGAGAASSLVVFALIAAAARPGVSAREALATEDAYFPWIGALHVLLDSIVDRGDDARIGQHSLVEHYKSPHEAAIRLRTIAAGALSCTSSLPDGSWHALILAAMASLYLSEPQASSPYANPAREEILATLGSLAAPTMRVLRARRALARIAADR